MKKDIFEVYQKAFQLGIDVIFAECREDVTMEGVHIIEPTTDTLIEAIEDAERYGCDFVIIHSKENWPYESA